MADGALRPGRDIGGSQGAVPEELDARKAWAKLAAKPTVVAQSTSKQVTEAEPVVDPVTSDYSKAIREAKSKAFAYVP